jgi:hypothetical protein
MTHLLVTKFRKGIGNALQSKRDGSILITFSYYSSSSLMRLTTMLFDHFSNITNLHSLPFISDSDRLILSIKFSTDMHNIMEDANDKAFVGYQTWQITPHLHFQISLHSPIKA